METETCIINPKDDIVPPKRRAIRSLSADDWIDAHASGTLRKNKRIGFTWRSQYLHERICYEFGFCFEILARSYVVFGDPITYGDCSFVTEAGWHIERYLTLSIFPEDYFETKYIEIEYPNGQKKEGVGIIVRKTSATWVPSGHIVFAIVAEFDPIKNDWVKVSNPF